MIRGTSALILPALTDTYKMSHPLQYPDGAREMSAYAECRSAFEKDPEDSRIVFYGIRYVVENYIAVPWTVEDVEKIEQFLNTQNIFETPIPFPKDLFLKFIKENNGYIPIRIEALPEGTVVSPHVPLYQITAKAEYARIVTFLETMLTHIWYPTTVATLSRRCKEVIRKAFEKSVDESAYFLLETRLHDFGFRGCTSMEQSVIGGVAHLLNFIGSDTMAGCYYAQMHLNKGKPVSCAIPATEHSVMTSWNNEESAVRKMINDFGGANRMFSVVLDSYDYSKALNDLLPRVAEEHKAKGGIMVLRPDSGNPVDTVLEALRAAEKTFGSVVNSKGFKVLKDVAVIQGDGMSYQAIVDVCNAVIEAGYSVQNVCFGMGAGLLQKINRDTMSFATKLNYISFEDGTHRDVMKRPKTDGGKTSLPGQLKVIRGADGLIKVVPKYASDADEELAAKLAAGIESKTDDGKSVPQETEGENLFRVVYDCGPVANAFPETFDELRARIESEWPKMPLHHDPVSDRLKAKIARIAAEMKAQAEKQ